MSDQLKTEEERSGNSINPANILSLPKANHEISLLANEWNAGLICHNLIVCNNSIAVSLSLLDWLTELNSNWRHSV